MSDERETTLARWSRLKRADREREPRAPPGDRLPEAVTPSAPAPGDGAADDGRDEAVAGDGGTTVPDLPDIAELNAESDFSAFLREGVSEDLRRRALRVLWRSDPVLANLDGLNDYDENFRAAGALAEAARTAYRVGKGYLSDDERGPAAEADAENKAENGEGAGAVDDAAADAVETADGSNESESAAADPEKKPE